MIEICQEITLTFLVLCGYVDVKKYCLSLINCSDLEKSQVLVSDVFKGLFYRFSVEKLLTYIDM